jgi:hypothetical protein
MRSYLASAGWRERPETWRGASLWDHPGGHGALVPPRDRMDDAEERTWELLQVLAKVEGRPPEEIAEDIASPMMDVQSVRTFPRDQPSGYVGLVAGLRALEGIRSLFALAARAEVQGRRFAYRGNHPVEVGGLLGVVQLGLTKPGSYVFTLRVPAEVAGQQELPVGGGYPPRRSTLRLFRAVAAARDATTVAVERGDFTAFDDTVALGVSANLCEALSDLGGVRRQQPFEIGFRWARGLPSDVSAKTVAFEAGTGEVLRNAAKRLWRLDSSGEAHVTGFVESLHDDPHADDRWRVRVRGNMVSGRGEIREQRTVWLRLREGDYQRAVDAHLGRRSVQASGVLVPTGRRTEIVVPADGFSVIS